MTPIKLKERIGTVKKNNFGSLMEVIDYNGSNDVLVKFLEHGNLKHATWKDFINGKVGNPYDKLVSGVGFMGEGDAIASLNGKATMQYSTWYNMIKRCYDVKYHKKRPTYVGCLVCKEWHNFQTFSKWFDENYYEIDTERMCLDKDILVKGNKIYSPETCIFVSHNINCLFIKKKTERGNYPIGVHFDKNNNKYVSKCGDNLGGSIEIGRFSTVEEAFHHYKQVKEGVIKKVANKYKDIIPSVLYEVMMKYEVEIND